MIPKKYLKYLVGILAAVFIILAVLPIFFEAKALNWAKNSINNQINGDFNFTGGKLSFIKAFPRLNLDLENVSLVNAAPFEGDTLGFAKEISLNLPLTSFFSSGGSGITISSFKVKNASVAIRLNEEGLANYETLSQTETGDEYENDLANENEDAFKLRLKKYEITNSNFSYNDLQGKIFLQLQNLNHSGSGDISVVISQLSTQTEAAVTFSMDSISYINKTPVMLDAKIEANLNENKFTFMENQAAINKLPLTFQGYFQLLEDHQKIDVQFKTPTSDFKNFLALVPSAYKEDLEKVKTEGNFEMNGNINGIIDDTHIPSFNITALSEGASFKYDDLPKAVKQIKINAQIANEDGLPESTHVLVNALNFTIDKDRFTAKGRLDDLTENLRVMALIDGTVNLGNLIRAYPFSKDNNIKGVLNANIETHFDMNSIRNKKYKSTRTSGKLDLNGFTWASSQMANDVVINRAAITFNPKTVSLNTLDAKTGATDLQASGTLTNLLGCIFNKEEVQGNFKLRSDLFQVSDFMVAETENPETESSETPPQPGAQKIKIPAFLDCTINAQAQKVIYDNITLNNVKGSLRIKEEKAELVDVSSGLFGGKLALNGSVSTKNDESTFDMDLGMDAFDIADSFGQLEMFQSLTPIAQSMDGKMNTTLKLKGKLNDDLSLDLNSLAGTALTQVLSSNLKPQKLNTLSALDSKLSFIDLSKVNLDNLKATFSFDKGRVNVNPFTIKYNDIDIEVGGSHGFDQSMAYDVNFNVPAKYFGSEAGALLSKLSAEDANSITVPVAASISGSFKKPQINTDISQSVANLSKQIIQHQKQKLINRAADSLTGGILGGLLKNKGMDSTETDANFVEKAAGDLLNSIFKKKKDKNDNK